jgi:flavorubredoxin
MCLRAVLSLRRAVATEEVQFQMEIVEGIHKVDGVDANVYLIIDGGKLTVVDAGMPKNARKIVDYVHRISQQF